jgi:hypothetical protein
MICYGFATVGARFAPHRAALRRAYSHHRAYRNVAQRRASRTRRAAQPAPTPPAPPRWTEETSSKLTEYDKLMDETRLLAMFDDDMDGKIEKAEFKGELGDKLSPYFAQMDQNKSGTIENSELMAALKVMGGQRRREQAQQAPAAPTPAAPAAKAGGGR